MAARTICEVYRRRSIAVLTYSVGSTAIPDDEMCLLHSAFHSEPFLIRTRTASMNDAQWSDETALVRHSFIVPGMTNDEFGEARARIDFARETVLGQQCEQYLRGGANDAARRHVSTEDFAASVRNGHMQMRAIWRQRARERENFEITVQCRGVLRARVSQLRHAETAHALNDERGLQTGVAQCVLKRDTNIVAGYEA